tara:strand:+ start:2661 stop:2915 length:255 start_codon:yes stop_codon:yes gene_type:complete
MNNNLKVGDVVLVRSFALANDDLIKVKLKKRIKKPKDFWGANGWDAQIIHKKDVDKLIRNGVPYKKGKKPSVWVFDFQLVEKVK